MPNEQGLYSPEEVAELKKEMDELRAKVGNADSAGELEGLRKELGELRGKAKGEIRGMSESTAHAIFEGMKRLSAQLDERKLEVDEDAPATAEPEDSWLPASLR